MVLKSFAFGEDVNGSNRKQIYFINICKVLSHCEAYVRVECGIQTHVEGSGYEPF